MLVLKRTSVRTILLLLGLLPVVSATISIVETGRTFDSKPEQKIGQRLYKGYQYMGRTQILHENESLCPQNLENGQKVSITTPEDGLPVALIITSGECSLEEKAMVATTMIEPSGIVQYLIIKDHTKRLGGAEDVNEENGEADTLAYIPTDLSIQIPRDDGYYLAVSTHQTVSANYATTLATDDESYLGRFLRVEEQPPVALIHVSIRVGNILSSIVNTESNMVRRSGGTKILLDGESPNGGARILLNWMLAILFMSVCGCCCMLMVVQTNMEDEQQQAPTQPVRRRLTLQEVRTRFPAYHFNPDEHLQQDNGTTQYCHLLDECTICLDEFHSGVRCRQLPCQHVFHSTCIARWLIERSATCPLCKMDLFEDEEEGEDDEESSADDEPQESEPLFSRRWWTGAAGSTGRITTPQTGDSAESRTWWPFSVEVAPSPEENGTSRPRPSRWRWNLFGQQRFQIGGRDSDALVTELTEPLIANEPTESLQPPPMQNPQQSLEEISFSPASISPTNETSTTEVPSGTHDASTETEIV